jgi:hypothetical protein
MDNEDSFSQRFPSLYAANEKLPPIKTNKKEYQLFMETMAAVEITCIDKKWAKEIIEKRAKDYRDNINIAKNKNELLEYRSRLSVCLLILQDLEI